LNGGTLKKGLNFEKEKKEEYSKSGKARNTRRDPEDDPSKKRTEDKEE